MYPGVKIPIWMGRGGGGAADFLKVWCHFSFFWARGPDSDNYLFGAWPACLKYCKHMPQVNVYVCAKIRFLVMMVLCFGSCLTVFDLMLE